MTDDTREGRTDVGGFYRWREKSPTGEVVVECPGYWPDSSGQKCARCGRSRWPHTTDNWVPTSDTEDVGEGPSPDIMLTQEEFERFRGMDRSDEAGVWVPLYRLARLRRTPETELPVGAIHVQPGEGHTWKLGDPLCLTCKAGRNTGQGEGRCPYPATQDPNAGGEDDG